MKAFLTVAEVAKLMHVSSRTVHELTRTAAIPHRRVAGTRRCLFVEEELEAWLDGAPLEVFETQNGSRVVRPSTP